MSVVRVAGGLAIVVVNAVVQTLLVLPDLDPELSPGFVLSAVASTGCVLLAAWLLAAVVGGTRPDRRTLLWTLLLAVVAVAASLLSVFLLPVVLVLGAPVLLAGPRAGGRLARAPGSSLAVVLWSLLLAALLWFGASLAGLFLGPVWGATATWLGLGLLAALVLRMWAGVLRRQARE